MIKKCFTVLLLGLMSTSAFAASGVPIVRDPAIESSSRAITIAWRTDTPGNSVVKIADKVVTDEALTTNHSVTVNGLEPSSEYRVDVWSQNTAGKSHYNNQVRTGAPNQKLIDRYGRDTIEALAAVHGAIDEDSLKPAVQRSLVLLDLMAARREIRMIDEQIAQVDQRKQATEKARDNFKSNSRDALPAEVIEQITSMIDSVPQISQQDLDSMVRLELERRLVVDRIAAGTLNSRKAEVAKVAQELEAKLAR